MTEFTINNINSTMCCSFSIFLGRMCVTTYAQHTDRPVCTYECRHTDFNVRIYFREHFLIFHLLPFLSPFSVEKNMPIRHCQTLCMDHVKKSLLAVIRIRCWILQRAKKTHAIDARNTQCNEMNRKLRETKIKLSVRIQYIWGHTRNILLLFFNYAFIQIENVWKVCNRTEAFMYICMWLWTHAIAAYYFYHI